MIEAATLSADGIIGTRPLGVRDANPALAAAGVLSALEPGNEALLSTAVFNLACQLAGQEVGGLPFGRLPGNLGTIGLNRADAIRAELAALSEDELRIRCVTLGAIPYLAPLPVAIGSDDEPDDDVEIDEADAVSIYGRLAV